MERGSSEIGKESTCNLPKSQLMAGVFDPGPGTSNHSHNDDNIDKAALFPLILDPEYIACPQRALLTFFPVNIELISPPCTRHILDKFRLPSGFL